MTSKDKTGDQLMASIRKTKTEGSAPAEKSAAAPSAASKPPAPKPAAPAAKKKAAAKPRPAPRKPAAKPRATQSASKGGSYQSTKRVWPD